MSVRNILFVGHDFKFLNHVIDHFSKLDNYEVALHHHIGHLLQDYDGLVRACLKADVVFCEWGLGNLSWLSRNHFPNQTIIVRVHSQEFRTDYLNDTTWNYIKKVILVGPHMKKQFDLKFPEHNDISLFIPNILDTVHFDLDKNEDAYFSLGLLGILPKSKAPHLAIELLHLLKSVDKRFKLFIKSFRPEEVSWVWEKDAEKKYYSEFYELINKLNLQDSVTYEGHGLDVSEWYRKIGFILSTSDFESFHMAVPEGMASGTIPIIRNWEGADMLYPSRFIFKDIKQAISIIKRYTNHEARKKEAAFLKKFSKKHFGKEIILKQYEELINEAFTLSYSGQSNPSARDVLSGIFSKQENTITELEANLSTIKNESILLQQSLSGKEQDIVALRNELSERIKKVDEIISIAEEMKSQLAAGRERESSKDKQIEAMQQEQNNYLNKISSLEEMIAAINNKLTVHAEREKMNNDLISGLTLKNEQQNQEITSLRETVTILNQIVASKDMDISGLKELNNEIQKEYATILSRNNDLESEMLTRNQQNLQLLDQIEQLNRDYGILLHNDKLKEQRQNELETKIALQNIEIQDLIKTTGEQGQLIHSLRQQNKEQQAYIQYLEKRFLNKMIGIIRKRFKKNL